MNFPHSQPIHILGGQSIVSADPDTTLITVLGSCVSACIYDPESGVGGMNHFILPTGGKLDTIDRSQRYGDIAMRTLVDTIRGFGKRRQKLQAKLYGGRTRGSSGTDAGAQNVAFARQFLVEEGIELVDACLGNDFARWVKFHPATGRVWLKVTTDPGKAHLKTAPARLKKLR